MKLVNMLKRLTDNYRKDPESNVGKLLNIAAGELEDIKASIEKTGQWRSIDDAQGKTLDRIGANFQQLRGQAPDSVYRILIKSKIARNLSDGSINTLIQTLAITLDIEPEGIKIRELWSDASPEPAAIFIGVPYDALNVVGMTLNQFGRLCNRIVAAGVRADVLVEGTFEFSSIVDESETDSEAGFSNLEQTTGGYLGAAYDPVYDPDLPL